MRILFFGDIVGKLGRRAILEVIPTAREEFKPDIIMANGENMAHGMGMTRKTLAEVRAAGVEIITSGNHIDDKEECTSVLSDPALQVLRPANYPPQVAGKGILIVEVGTRRLVVINLLGRVFMREKLDCPFRTLDALLTAPEVKVAQAVVVDFHAEATSEKIAFGWYANGRVAAVVGTHTHVPTIDARILPGGTAYVTDVGMVGPRDGVIGVKKEGPMKGFLTQLSTKLEVLEEGVAQVNAVVVDIDVASGRATAITRYDKELSAL